MRIELWHLREDIFLMYEKIFESTILLGKNILDIGTGEGKAALYLAESVGQNGTVVTVDIDIAWTEKMHLLAKETGLEDTIVPYCADARNLSFCDDCFDVVAAIGAFLDIEDFNPGSSKTVLEEAYRVLKPGGKLIVSQFHPNIRPQDESQEVFYDYLRLQAEVLRVIEEDAQFVYYSPEWFADQMREIGFVDIEWKTFPGERENIPDDHLRSLRMGVEGIECIDLRKRYHGEIISISERQEEFGATMVLFALGGVKGRI